MGVNHQDRITLTMRSDKAAKLDLLLPMSVLEVVSTIDSSL